MVSSLLMRCEQPFFVHWRVGMLARPEDSVDDRPICVRAREAARALSILFTRSPGIAYPLVFLPVTQTTASRKGRGSIDALRVKFGGGRQIERRKGQACGGRARCSRWRRKAQV